MTGHLQNNYRVITHVSLGLPWLTLADCNTDWGWRSICIHFLGVCFLDWVDITTWRAKRVMWFGLYNVQSQWLSDAYKTKTYTLCGQMYWGTCSFNLEGLLGHGNPWHEVPSSPFLCWCSCREGLDFCSYWASRVLATFPHYLPHLATL